MMIARLVTRYHARTAMSGKPKERRRSQRIELDEQDRITAAIETPGGSSFEGQIADFSIDGVTICFQGGELPPLFMGQTVTITLRVAMPSQEYSVVDIEATVRKFAYDPASGISRCGLEFCHRVRRDSILFSTLFAIANQRGAARIEPDSKNPVAIALKLPDGFQAEGTIRDISATGVGVVVPGSLEGADVGQDTVDVIFSLPDADGDVDMSGTIRHKKLDFDATWVGIEFNEQDESRTDLQQKKIVDYVMQRQRDLLKK